MAHVIPKTTFVKDPAEDSSRSLEAQKGFKGPGKYIRDEVKKLKPVREHTAMQPFFKGKGAK